MNLRLHQVVVRRGSFTFGPLSLEVPPGEKLTLLGRSGSGKSTLLKLLAGLLPPADGQVLWNGEDVWRLPAQARREAQATLGMVFQKDALFDSDTVLENVLLPLRNREVPAEEAARRAAEALAAVKLGQAAAQRPEVLSGGMKKRVGIARAIVARPQVLLADDPFAGLDPNTAAAIARALLDAAEGRTLVVALPDPVEFLRTDRALRLEGGRLSS